MSIERFAVSEFSTLKWSFDDDVTNLKSNGVNAVGVWRHKLDEFGDERGAELLIDQRMSVSSLQWAGEFTGAGVLSLDEAIEDARTAIYEAALIGAGCLIVHTGSRNGHTSSHAMRLIRTALGELLPIARDYGVTLAIEPTHRVHGRNWSFLHHLDCVQELIAEFGTRNLGIVYDTFHMGRDADFQEQLLNCVDNICLVQLSDSQYDEMTGHFRDIPGKGSLPLWDILKTLEDNGYDGFYELEVFGRAVEHQGYVRTVQQSMLAISEFTSGIKSSQRQR